MGDASDNIPGVPGVGEKTALELLKQFGNINNILENTSQIKKNKVRENVENNKEMATMSKRLATIHRDIPVDMNIRKYLFKDADYDVLYELYKKLEFKSLMDKIGHLVAKDENTKPKEEIKYCLIDNESDVKRIFDEIRQNGLFAFKLSSDEYGLPDYIYIAFDDKIFYVPINDFSRPIIKSVLEDKEIFKAGHDLKTDMVMLKGTGINVESIKFDSMIGAYLLNPSNSGYRLKDTYKEYIGEDISDCEDKEGDIHEKYCSSVWAIWNLIKPLDDKITQMGMEKLYHEVELPLVEVLADMEHNGFKVDMEKLKELSEDFSNRIEKLTEDIYHEAGEEFNINSTKQLSHILFDKLKLPPIKKTKTGYSTDVEVLERLFDKHAIIEKLLEYRQIIKLKSTYIDGLIGIINPKTGKIHSKFNQTATATGRLSSTEPNLQNIPIKTENGREIRKVFVAENENYLLVDADYSQIELRVLAHISGDENLIDAFKNNEDIHSKTAAEVFEVDKDMVTPLMRSRAKAVNFGIVYGISDYGLSRDLKIPRKEAKIYIDSYFRRYPKVKKYMEDIVKDGKAKGYVTTILNRMRYIPELASSNAIKRNFGERMAMNTPIQGSAADIIKIAMVNVYKELKNKNMKSRLILQVHDELIIEAHIDEVDAVKQILKNNMEKAVSLCIPLIADINMGYSWYEAK